MGRIVTVAAGAFVDAGLITNQWGNVTEDDIRPSVGVALIRVVTPFGLIDKPKCRGEPAFIPRAHFNHCPLFRAQQLHA